MSRYEDLKEQYERENWDSLGDGLAHFEAQHLLSFFGTPIFSKTDDYGSSIRILTWRDEDIEILTIINFWGPGAGIPYWDVDVFNSKWHYDYEKKFGLFVMGIVSTAVRITSLTIDYYFEMELRRNKDAPR